MLLQFDLIPARVKGRVFESRGKRRAPCTRSRRGSKPKRKTNREKNGDRAVTPPVWLRDALCQ